MLETNRLKVTIYPDNQATFGPCDCCGNLTSRIWGYVEDGEVAIAAYYVEWTPGHEGRHANFDLIVGKWGENTEPSDRQAIALEFRRLENGPAFMVIDAGVRKIATSTLVSKALDRAEVIATPLAAQVFSICDVIYLEDPRISELRR